MERTGLVIQGKEGYPRFTFVGCEIKPGGSVWCGAKNSNTEIHTHEGFRAKTQKLQCFFKIVFTPLCIHIFMSGTLHDKREK